MNYDKNIKDLYDFMDIIKDYKKTEYLLQNNQLDLLQNHLNDMSVKYLAEKIMYNSINTQPPQSLQQNAYNFMIFLKKLYEIKGLKKSFDEALKEI